MTHGISRRKAGIVLSAVLIGASVPALAQDTAPIEARQAMMKNVGAAMKIAGGMAGGQIAYDPVAAALAMRTMNTAANGFGALFPVGSEQGSNTEAGARIWSDRADFNAKLAAFRRDTVAAIENAAGGLESYKAAFGAVAKNCKGCHEAYRVKRK